MSQPGPTRFTPPWRAVESGESFYVEDAVGHRFAFTYFDDPPTKGGVVNFGRHTKDEARRITANIAKLPDLLGKA